MNSSLQLTSVTLLVSLILAGCGRSDSPEKRAVEPGAVSVAEAGTSVSPHALAYSGTVTSKQSVQISTKIMGRIARLAVEEGDYASRGDLLVRIHDENIQAQKRQAEAGLTEAEAALGNAEADYRRFQELFRQESATQKELDDMTTRYERARANVQALQGRLSELNDMLSYTVLRAPFDGHVVAKRATEGEMASPGQPLLTFDREAARKIVVTVPESHISHFQTEDPVAVQVPAAGLRDTPGTVTRVNPSADPVSRQFTVEIHLDNSEDDTGLKSGMFAKVVRTVPGEPALTIPQDAVVERGQLSGVFTLNNDSELVLRWVRLGQQTGSSVEVLSGLATGERYVTSLNGALREGQKVSVQ